MPEPTVIQHTFTRRAGQQDTVDAIQPQPGLVIYSDEQVKTEKRYHWFLGHHSGFAIAAFEYPGDADDAAWLIRDFTDWTRSAEDITADKSIKASDLYDLIISHTPGLFVAAAHQAA